MRVSPIIFILILFYGCTPEDGWIHLKGESLILVIAGQSNAVGQGDSSTSLFESSTCFEFHSQLNSIVPLKDPVGQSHMNFEKANTGSLAPSLAFHLSSVADKSVLIIQCGKGGSSLHPFAEHDSWGNWSETGNLLKNSFRKINLALFEVQKDFNSYPKVSAIIWSQGENDGEAVGLGVLSQEEYKYALKELIANYRNEFGEKLPFLIVETGRHITCDVCDRGFEMVRQVQREVADEDINTFIGYNETEFFIERNWLTNSVHYNQMALNDIGKKLANMLIDSNVFN